MIIADTLPSLTRARLEATSSRRSIVRAFEVEHTTAVYSGLLRMADLLALQPNMDIRLHIVAPDERRDAGLDRAEGVLDRLAPLAHGRRVLVEPPLHGFENRLMLPARDPALFGWRALALDRAARAGGGPKRRSVRPFSTFV